MKRKMPLAVASLLLALAVYAVACNRGVLYRGDGHLTDAGIGAAHERYILDLGPIDLTKRGEAGFVLAGLPGTTMTVGFQASPSHERERIWETKPLNAGVQIRLTRPDDVVVIDESSRLPMWVWSSKATSLESFIYRAGRDEPIDLGNGLSTYRLLGVRPDGGWGTYFDPRPLRRYRLTVRVMEPMTGRRYPVRLVIKGGGWK